MTQPDRMEDEQRGRTTLEDVHGGLAIHIPAVVHLIEGTDLSDWEKDSLRADGGNALSYMYLMDMVRGFSVDPSALAPNYESHMALFGQTKAEYSRILSQRIRLFLAGEEGLEVDDPTSPISEDESAFYLEKARERGILKPFIGPMPQVKINNELSYDLHLLAKSGIYFATVDEYSDLLYLERFRYDLILASIHKLACFLALIDRMAYEGEQNDKSVPADYVPTPGRDGPEFLEFETSQYGGRVPTLGELYQLAHDVVFRFAAEDDPFIEHLRNLKPAFV